MEKSLGPVADLEEHLTSDWWRTIFNATYLKTDADVIENEENTRREVDLLIQLTGIEPSDHILDLCCGQGRHSIELARRGFGFVRGIDRSKYLIRLARSRGASLSIPFSEGDARKIKLPESSLDLVFLMGNSFGYFERAEEDKEVLRGVKRVLRSKGVLFLDIVDGDWMRSNFEKRSWEWIDEKLFVCRERKLASDDKRLISREVVTDTRKGVVTDQFYAERLYNWSEMNHLLRGLGYSNIRHHGNIETSSTRNEDLGMMARRCIITAEK